MKKLIIRQLGIQKANKKGHNEKSLAQSEEERAQSIEVTSTNDQMAKFHGVSDILLRRQREIQERMLKKWSQNVIKYRHGGNIQPKQLIEMKSHISVKMIQKASTARRILHSPKSRLREMEKLALMRWKDNTIRILSEKIIQHPVVANQFVKIVEMKRLASAKVAENPHVKELLELKAQVSAKLTEYVNTMVKSSDGMSERKQLALNKWKNYTNAIQKSDRVGQMKEFVLAKWLQICKTNSNSSELSSQKQVKLTIIVDQVLGFVPKSSKEKYGKFFVQIKYGKQTYATKLVDLRMDELSGCNIVPQWDERAEMDFEIDCKVIEFIVWEKLSIRRMFHGKVFLYLEQLLNTPDELKKMIRDGFQLVNQKGEADHNYKGILAVGIMKWTNDPFLEEKGEDLDNLKSEIEEDSDNEEEFMQQLFDQRPMTTTRKFRLKHQLQATGCEQYIKTLHREGYNDPGSFSNLSEKTLRQDCHIYNQHHLRILCQLAANLKNEMKAKQYEKQNILPNQLATLTVDGKMFFKSYAQLEGGLAAAKKEKHRYSKEENIVNERRKIIQQRKNQSSGKISSQQNRDEEIFVSAQKEIRKDRLKDIWTSSMKQIFHDRVYINDDEDDDNDDLYPKEDCQDTGQDHATLSLYDSIDQLVASSNLIAAIQRISKCSAAEKSKVLAIASAKTNALLVKILLPYADKRTIDQTFISTCSHGHEELAQLYRNYVGMQALRRGVIAAIVKLKFNLVQLFFPCLGPDEVTVILAAIQSQDRPIIAYVLQHSSLSCQQQVRHILDVQDMRSPHLDLLQFTSPRSEKKSSA